MCPGGWHLGGEEGGAAPGSRLIGLGIHPWAAPEGGKEAKGAGSSAIPSLFPPFWRFGRQWVEWGQPQSLQENLGHFILRLLGHLGQAGRTGGKLAGNKWTKVPTEAKGMEVRQQEGLPNNQEVE